MYANRIKALIAQRDGACVYKWKNLNGYRFNDIHTCFNLFYQANLSEIYH